jgi:hypothetical protein
MNSRLLVYVGAFAWAAGAQAQTSPTTTTPTRIETYRFGASVPVQECSFETGVSDPTDRTRETGVSDPTDRTRTIDAPNGARFAYVGDAAVNGRARVILQFLQWPDTSYRYRRFNVELTPAAEQRLAAAAERISPADIARTRTFCVDKEIFNRTSTRVYRRFSWDLAAGVLLLPIKLRGGGSRDFDFSKDVTLGTVAGPRWRIHSQRDVFVSVLGGAGITAVTLDAENTAGVVTEATDRAAVTVTTGVMFEVNRFQLGLMVGWDQISNPNQQNWEYQGHRWLSLGLGYTLLSAPPSQPATLQ